MVLTPDRRRGAPRRPLAQLVGQLQSRSVHPKWGSARVGDGSRAFAEAAQGTAFFVVMTTTPLAPRKPYWAVAPPSFSTCITEMSLGLMPMVPP